MTKYGVHSMLWTEFFGEKDLNILKKVKSLGFDVIDIAIPDPDTFPSKQIKERAGEVGIELVTSCDLSPETNIIDPDPQIRKKGVEILKKFVDVNISLDCKILGGATYAAWGYITGKPRTNNEWNWGVECLREAAIYAKDNSDLIIAVEPMNRFETFFLNIAEDAVKFCKDVGTGNVRILLDTFHMIREEKSFQKAIETCGKEFLGYFHVSENDRGIPGTGLIPWEEFFKTIKKIGFNGPLIIESFDPNFEKFNSLCAIWRKHAETGEEFAIKSLENLKAIEKTIQ